jgi:hypothetical protein
MATTEIGRGRLAQLAIVDEATFGVVPVSGFAGTYFYSETLRETFPLDADPLLGINPNNSRDQVAPAPSLTEHGGSLDVPVCWNHFGHWLKCLFGAPTTTGSTNKTHVFASGAATLPTKVLEFRKLANDFRQHVGVAADEIEWDFEDKSGFHMAKITMIGRGENLLTSSAAGTPTTLTLDQIPATKGVVRVNGVAQGFVRQGKFRYKNGLATERYVDDTPRAAAIVIDADAECDGELRLRHNSTAFDTLAMAETVQPVEIEWQKGANNSLVITMPACRFERPSTPIAGPGGIEQTVRFRAHQSASGPMVTVTLKNQVASY